MRYAVLLERQAIKQLSSLPNPARLKIQEALQLLSENPRPHGYIKLKGRPAYRIRVNDYRIIYNIKDDILTVYVLVIGNRKNVYD